MHRAQRVERGSRRLDHVGGDVAPRPFEKHPEPRGSFGMVWTGSVTLEPEKGRKTGITVSAS